MAGSDDKFSPTSAASMIAHFEHAYPSPVPKPFYYEPKTTTINFGYGSNLTGAEDATDTTLKDDYSTWLKANGVTLSDEDHKSLSKDNLKSGNGESVAGDLNANLPKTVTDWQQQSLSIMDSYFNTIVIPEITEDFPGFSSLSSNEKTALANVYYDHKTLLGNKVYTAAAGGKRADEATELAFNSEPADPGSPGLEQRLLGSGMLALGVTPTYNGSNVITDVTISDAKASDIASFLTNTLSDNKLGSGGNISASHYVAQWGRGPTTSFNTVEQKLDGVLEKKGEYVAAAVDDVPGINDHDITLTGDKFVLVNSQSYTGTVAGFVPGTDLDLAMIGTATSATIDAQKVLTVTGAKGGPVSLMLNPAQDFSGMTPMVSADGNGGTIVSLGPAPSHIVTFSEPDHPYGQSNPVYTFSDITVRFNGQIVQDASQPATPVIAADYQYIGPVTISFDKPVEHVEFDAGYFDSLGSTTISYIGPGGKVLSRSQNSSLGIVHYSHDEANGISAVEVVNTGTDPQGFSVDTVRFNGPVGQPLADTTFNIVPTNMAPAPANDPIYTFSVTRTGDISTAASVGYVVLAGTGRNPLTNADFPDGKFPAGQIQFAAGQASQMVDVHVIGDFIPYSDYAKSFQISLIAPSSGTQIGMASVNATTLPPPAINNTMAGQQTTDLAPVKPFSALKITDPNYNNPTEMVTVTLSDPDNGTLTSFTEGTYNAATGVYAVEGYSGQVTRDLNGLTFIPTAQQVEPGKAVTTNFTVKAVDTAGTFVSDTATSVTVTADPVCFCSGTLIRTSQGDQTVETLSVGDLIITASGKLRPIVWLGHRAIDCCSAGRPSQFWPVRVRAGAFGNSLPERELFLSPGHPVLVSCGANELLVPIMCLINGTSIDRLPVDQVTYWHVELDAHDILFAEGLPVESFLNCGNRSWFENGEKDALANPDFIVRGLGARCRTVDLDGPVVQAERRRLDALFEISLITPCAWPNEHEVLLGF